MSTDGAGAQLLRLPTVGGGPATGRPRDAGLLVGLGAGLLALAFAAGALKGLSYSTAILPAIALLAVAGPFLLARPAWIAPLFVALTWTSVGRATFGGLPTPVELGGPVLILAAAWLALPRLRFARDVLVVCLLIAAPAVAAGFVATVAAEPGSSPISDLSFLFIVALALRGAPDVRRAAVALVATGVVLGLAGVWSVQVAPFGPFTITDEGSEQLGTTLLRAAGAFGDPNFFALSLAALLPPAAYLAAERGWTRLLGLAGLACCCAGIYATGSRGGIIASTAGLAAFGLLSADRTTRRRTVAALAALVVAIPVLASVLGGNANREVGGRATENLIALAMFADHPVLGVGPGAYPALYRGYSRRLGDDPRTVRMPHSLPLQIAAEQGVAGVLGWLAALSILARFVVVKRIWRTRLGRAVIGALLAYGTGSLFLHGGQLRLLYMLIGLLLALAGAARSGRTTTEVAA